MASIRRLCHYSAPDRRPLEIGHSRVGCSREFEQHAARLRNGLSLQAQPRPARGNPYGAWLITGLWVPDYAGTTALRTMPIASRLGLHPNGTYLTFLG